MRLVSFNLNGTRARLHRLQAIVDKHRPELIGLQETKVSDEEAGALRPIAARRPRLGAPG